MDKGLLILSWIYGVSPWNISRRSSCCNILAYGQMLMMLFFYLTCYALVNFDFFGIYHVPDCNSFCRLGNQLFLHLGCLLYLTTQLLAMKSRKKFCKKFEQTLINIDRSLETRQVDERGEMSMKRNQSLHFLYKMSMTLGLLMLLIYEVRQLTHFYGHWFFVPLMVTTYPYSAATVMLLQFAYYVYKISERHQIINHFLDQINQDIDKTPKEITPEIFDVESELKITSSGNVQSNKRHVKQTTHRREEHDYNEDSMKFLESRTKRYATTTSLTKLFKLFDSVLSLSVLTNNEYGPHCVPYMSACFVITIFCIFFQIKIYHVVGGKSRLLDYIVFMYFIWSFVTMLVTYIVLRLCCNASGEAKQTAVIVQEIMRKRPAFMLGVDGNYNEMKSFLLQSLHWEEYFQYNAIGLFSLDYTLIFTMISAATSYLIVLLQVDISSILQTEGLL